MPAPYVSQGVCGIEGQGFRNECKGEESLNFLMTENKEGQNADVYGQSDCGMFKDHH